MMLPETAHALGSTADTLTILRSRGRRLAKLVRTDGTIEGYDWARRFDLITVAVQGLDGLGGILRSLMGRPECCIVRGAVIDPSRTKGVRRLLYPDGESGDPPTLRDVPRCWVGLDIDGLPRSTKVAASDLAGCAAVVIETLPPEFRRASCIVQATASHGIKPGVRLRLWYWLNRPATGTELKRWLRGAPVDHAVFGAAQIIYTASPLFAPGISDPLSERSTLIARDDSEVRAPQPSCLVEDRSVRSAAHGKVMIPDGHALGGLVRKLAGAAEGERNTIAFWAACRAGEMAASGFIRTDTAAALIAQAAMLAGLSQAEAERTALSGIRTGLRSAADA